MGYAHPPIVEAALELECESERAALEVLSSVHDSLWDDYPEARREVRRPFELGSQQTAEGPQAAGYTLRSADGLRVLQVRPDAFAFSRLAPYDGWEAFSEEARRLWLVYRDVVNVGAVTRIGLRYVNRLDLPLPFCDFKEYLTTVPEVSPGLPQGLGQYYMRLLIPWDNTGRAVWLTEALAQPEREGVASIVLDIDAFCEAKLVADSEVWDCVAGLREVKNAVFEACITERMREMFA